MRRDPFEGAVPRDVYFSQPMEKGKKSLAKAVQSQAKGKAYAVPSNERRTVKEAQIQNEILKWLRSKGAWVVKYDATRLVGSGDTLALAPLERGVPDLIVCLDGKFVGIEVKAARAGVRVSAEQLAQGEGIRNAGGVWLVTHSVDDLERKLMEEGLLELF